MTDNLRELEKRRAALLQQRKELQSKLTLERQQVADSQEEALLQTPQHLLTQVRAGSAEDFKNVLHELHKEGKTNIQSLLSKMDSMVASGTDC